MEPTNATVEGGCQGTVRADVVLRGHRAHSARSWMGSNAIHAAGDPLQRLAAYQAAEVEIDGLTYREGMNAVGITGGVAGNVIPDECRVTVNYRFAPDKNEDQAAEVVRRVLSGFEVEISDSAPGALPGLSHPAAAEFVAMVGREPLPKFGWTDVARFSALGVPAVNYGPGDPSVAHQREEYCDIAPIRECEQKMRAWLGA
jgi:succinyl-diaminopimelate desuccinylase